MFSVKFKGLEGRKLCKNPVKKLFWTEGFFLLFFRRRYLGTITVNRMFFDEINQASQPVWPDGQIMLKSPNLIILV